MRQSDLLGLFALCLLSVCRHDIIVILSPVSLSVAWDVRVIRVIWGFNFIRGFRVIWVCVVIIFVGRFEMVV